MSWRAMEAVLLTSQYRHDAGSGENFAPYRIMMALASLADAAGMVGVAGDALRCPSQRALADRSGVHRNTVASWLPRLVTEGELAVVGSGGSGRGCWTQYQITIVGVPIVPGLAQDTRENEANNGLTPLQEMAQAMALMAHEMAQLRQLLAHQNGTNGTTPSPVGGPDPIEIREIQEDPTLTDGGGVPASPSEPAESDVSLTEQALTVFCQETGINAPRHRRRTEWADGWIHPLNELLGMVGDDVPALQQLVQAAAAHMAANGLTVARPASLVNVARSRPWERQGAGPGPSANGGGPQQPRAVAALAEFKRRQAAQEDD